MTHYTVTVPIKGKDERTHYRRVGAMFENHNRNTGEVYYSIKLDFPVGATEMLAFPPRAEGGEAPEPEDSEGAGQEEQNDGQS